MALRRRPLLLAVHHYRVGERRYPDHDDEGVEEQGGRTLDTDGPHEGPHVGDEDDAADRRAQDAGRQDTNDVGRYRRGDDAADEQRPDDLPWDLREAEREEEPDAGAEGEDRKSVA